LSPLTRGLCDKNEQNVATLTVQPNVGDGDRFKLVDPLTNRTQLGKVTNKATDGPRNVSPTIKSTELEYSNKQWQRSSSVCNANQQLGASAESNLAASIATSGETTWRKRYGNVAVPCTQPAKQTDLKRNNVAMQQLRVQCQPRRRENKHSANLCAPQT
jgi:hypothetical protein